MIDPTKSPMIRPMITIHVEAGELPISLVVRGRGMLEIMMAGAVDWGSGADVRPLTIEETTASDDVPRFERLTERAVGADISFEDIVRSVHEVINNARFSGATDTP